MKKIVMIFAAMAAVLSSCGKSELESASTNESKDIVLNISVSNPGLDESKALVKTGWAVNDEISIWYDNNDGATPDLVITYNGTKWIQKEGATVSGNTPSEGSGKYAKALYNGTVKVASKDDYTFENSTLTFNIANWKFLTEVQVVVKGLTSASAGSYTLACDKFTPLAAGNGYTVGSDAITASAGKKGVAVTGISNTDGVAFVFATADYSATAAAYKFTLKDETSGSAVTKVYRPNVAIAAKEGKSSIKALTIVNTKFAVPAAPDGFVDLGVVVNSNPVYWATKNLGATNPEDYGKYYSWGDVLGQTIPDSAFSPGFSWSNAPFNGGQPSYSSTEFNKVKDTVCPNGILAPAYDAATAANSSWRTPTSEEFKALAASCVWIWTTDYNSTGKAGYIVYKAKNDADKGKANMNGIWKKWQGSSYSNDSAATGSYSIADTHIFFPAAGYGNGTSLSSASTGGRYWSSSLCTGGTRSAYCLIFNKGGVTPQSSDNRYYGFSVRPVSD